MPPGPQAMVFEALPREQPSAPNPYAPMPSPEGPLYSWQSATPSKCRAAPPIESMLPLFDASAVVCPMLAADNPRLLQSPSLPEYLAPAVSAEQPAEARSAPSPELVVAGLRPRFRQCFSRWLDAKDDAQGSVNFALELGCGGDVQAISAVVKGVDEPTLECLFTVVAPARFEPPAGGHATIQVPVVFKNAAR